MNPFTKVTNFVTKTTSSVFNLAIAVLTIGFIVSGFMVWNGSEENVPRFKKTLFWTGAGVAAVVLAKVIVGWIKAGVA